MRVRTIVEGLVEGMIVTQVVIGILYLLASRGFCMLWFNFVLIANLDNVQRCIATMPK